MHPELSEEQSELQASVDRFARHYVSPEKLQAWEKSDGIDAQTWKGICELGWLGVGVGAESGGSGLGIIEVACVLEECARALVPRRVNNAIRGAAALARLDPGAAELPELCLGRKRLTMAIDERNARRPGNFTCRLLRESGDARVSGEKWCVIDPGADWHLVAAGDDGNTVALVLIDAASVEVSPLRSFDGSAQGAVCYDNAKVVRIVAAGEESFRSVQRVQTALALAEMLGGMRAALEATVEYVKQREQFGQKIGVFQAVQHQVADMSLAFTASRHLAWQAISRLAKGSEEGVELESAVVFVSRSFKDITLSAHHLHGGAGYIVEHPLHYHSERAQSLAIRYAPEAEAFDVVAASLLD